MSGLPTPTHRNPDEPQPEVCGVCGLHVGGAHLRDADTAGLRGVRVCDVTPGCREFGTRLSYRDRRQNNPQQHGVIGQGRVFLPGSVDWAE